MFDGRDRVVSSTWPGGPGTSLTGGTRHPDEPGAEARGGDRRRGRRGGSPRVVELGEVGGQGRVIEPAAIEPSVDLAEGAGVGAAGTAVLSMTVRASLVLGWLTSARLSTMVAGVLATSAISIVLVMAARSGKLGWSGMRMWSLSLATVTASAPECGGVSVTISSAPSRPRASTRAAVRLLGVAKTGGSSSPLALRRSCHFAADAWESRTAVAVSAREARAARAHDSVVFPVPPLRDSTLTTRGRGASGGRVRVAGWMSVIGYSGARSGARASLDVSVT